MEKIEIDNQTLFPLEYEGAFYYVRFVHRGSRLDCSGVYKFEISGERIVPEFQYQNMNKTKIRRIMLVAKQDYLRQK